MSNYCKNIVLNLPNNSEIVAQLKGNNYENIRMEIKKWSWDVVQLIKNVQQSIRKFYDIQKLRFLQYPSGLRAEDIAEIKKDGAGVVWLGNN